MLLSILMKTKIKPPAEIRLFYSSTELSQTKNPLLGCVECGKPGTPNIEL